MIFYKLPQYLQKRIRILVAEIDLALLSAKGDIVKVYVGKYCDAWSTPKGAIAWVQEYYEFLGWDVTYDVVTQEFIFTGASGVFGEELSEGKLDEVCDTFANVFNGKLTDLEGFENVLPVTDLAALQNDPNKYCHLTKNLMVTHRNSSTPFRHSFAKTDTVKFVKNKTAINVFGWCGTRYFEKELVKLATKIIDKNALHMNVYASSIIDLVDKARMEFGNNNVRIIVSSGIQEVCRQLPITGMKIADLNDRPYEIIGYYDTMPVAIVEEDFNFVRIISMDDIAFNIASKVRYNNAVLDGDRQSASATFTSEVTVNLYPPKAVNWWTCTLRGL